VLAPVGEKGQNHVITGERTFSSPGAPAAR
jgi:hypothetical protein